MNIIFLPLIIPLISAVLVGLFGSSIKLRMIISSLSALIQTILGFYFIYACWQGAILAASSGSWMAPYGIVIAIDLFSAFFLGTVSLVFLASLMYSHIEELYGQKVSGLRFILIFILQAGVNLSLITGDFFNLFVAFEIMLTASYGLMSLEIEEKHIKFAFPYLMINLAAALAFLCAAAMVYGYTSNLNFAAIASLFNGRETDPLIVGFSYLLLVIFGLKAGLFPLYFWLPSSYPFLPAPIAALFAGTLTKVGIYVLIRIFILVLPGPLLAVDSIIIAFAVMTMLVGVLGAIAQNTIKGILSFHIISQVGYMVLAIGFYTPLAVIASLLFTLHNILVKSSLFLLGGMANRIYQTDDLYKMGNLSIFMPFLSFCFLLQALSLAGLPPLSGFWGKYLLILEGIKFEHYLAVAAAVLTSWLTLFSMMKIWAKAFWGEEKKIPAKSLMQIRPFLYPTLLLIIAATCLGLGTEKAFEGASLAVKQLFEKQSYLHTILNLEGKGNPI